MVLLVIPGALYAAIPADAAEAVFWGAAFFLLGREVVRRYRRLFDPRRWFGEMPG